MVGKKEIARAGGIKAALDEAHSAVSMRMTPRAITAYEAVGSAPAEEDGAGVMVQIVVGNEEELREAIGAGAEAVLIEVASTEEGRRLGEVARGLRGDCVVEEVKGRGLTQRALRKSTESTEKIFRDIVGCRGPSTARPDAPQFGAEEKIGPLRSG
ncbi:MAG TPA: hypothetical protein VK805_14085 [Candidatus Baltobacteraceae bacterium]|nr:hypothetical protein [Candidatus Baltobacteraceae bacterium]